MDVSVVIGTFGDLAWSRLAENRAVPSVPPGVPVIHRHADTLHDARNAALVEVATEWVIHLDADDELEPGYIEAMERGTADVRGPMARYVTAHRRRLWRPQVFAHDERHPTCEGNCLVDGNWLLIGSAVRAQMAREVGGWRDFAWSEDWDLWARCYKAGATFELIEDAIYRAHVRPDSRNRGATAEAKQAAHEAIYAANFG